MRDTNRNYATGAYEDNRLEFPRGGAPWRHSCAESLIKTVKKSLFFTVGRQKHSILVTNRFD